jgi:hypothetical protein
MKLDLRSRAALAMSSAALALSFPALTNTLATPVKVDGAGSTRVSVAMVYQCGRAEFSRRVRDN